MASLELGSLSIRSYAFEMVISEIQQRLLPLLSSVAGKADGVLDLQDVFRRFSFDHICQFSFAFDPGCLQLSLPISDFAVAFDLASKLSAERAITASPLIWKIKRIFNIGTEKKLKEAIKLVNVLAEQVIDHRRNMGFSTQKDLLSRFMGTVNDDRHPDVESAIRDESDRIMGPTQELASFEQMREMHYLQAAMYESMRLYPPVQFDSKFTQEDDVLPDSTFVRKGTRVTYHPYAMGRMERVWGPDCLEFKPERWLQNGVFTPENPFKYPVFQAGPRVCLGKELALAEMKSVALSLIRRFDIQVATPGQTQRFAPGLTATLRGGLPVLIRDRRA
ncbi:hypothetical protein F0562_001864 [Nyssa sinensis]|uniref:Cytochrome P450 n=1 Tax=Nyssa sinensis TaxID=561372 RepID=A0A5J5C869_9ASTE|nr:hypothetical protein F0562_001864 [Nyssa sinensis]